MKRTPMAQALLKSTATKNAQLVSVEPDVKSSKTRELFNAGVSENPETGKSADPTCYNSVTVGLTGLFDNWRTSMKPRFKQGDIVTIFQMCSRRGLMIEGKASIVRPVEDVDEQYEVRFVNEPGEVYERFVDSQVGAQENPTRYQQEFNKRLGIAA